MIVNPMNRRFMEELITEIIKDLGSGKPINGILLKSQIIASELNNSTFSDWISNEQNGYPNAENLPQYRVLAAIVKADVFVPYWGCVNNQTIPAGIFDHQLINDCMEHARIINSLTEIESICVQNKDGGMLSYPLPAMAYPEVNKCINGNAQRVWQEFPVSSLAHIVDVFKSKLLDFFLNLNKEVKAGIDFSHISSQENQQKISQIMNNTYNINAAVANTGSGSISTGDVSASNLQMNPSDNLRSQMNDVIAKLEDVIKEYDNSDINDALGTLKEETAKTSWNSKILRITLNAINGIANGILANQLTPIVAQGLSLL